MGNKIITEKDFWTCTGGLVPAQLQVHQRSTKKINGSFNYVTVEDTATSSWMDFSCKKLMLVLALLAVAIALVTVATGGLALIAICAAAAAVGAVVGAIVGSLVCGQLAATARYWMQSKSNLIIQGQQAITGDHKMQCMIFGDIISFAPQIKNWWQAYALGASNLLGEVLKCAMYGAAIGSGVAILEGGPAVLAEFGTSNIGANWLATYTTGAGLGLRGVMATQNMLGAYGNTGTITGGDVVNSAFAMEIGTAKAAGNIMSGNGTFDDYLGVAMWMMPAPKGNRGGSEETRTNESETPNEENKPQEEEETPQARTAETETPAQAGEFDAFEDSPGTEPPPVEVPRLPEMRPDDPFRPGDGHDVAEFERQIQGQQEGMNNLTVDEFLANRDAYLQNGRSRAGSRAQRDYRAQAERDIINEQVEQGRTLDEARQTARDQMSDQAALHDPDQIAGGHGDNITGLGDANVNSSIGSQWKTRIGSIDRQVRDQAANMTQAEREATHLNVHLYP